MISAVLIDRAGVEFMKVALETPAPFVCISHLFNTTSIGIAHEAPQQDTDYKLRWFELESTQGTLFQDDTRYFEWGGIDERTELHRRHGSTFVELRRQSLRQQRVGGIRQSV